ncbi:MAG: signal recognition particle-docking protein FtsY [Parvularculaceae bacterium]
MAAKFFSGLFGGKKTEDAVAAESAPETIAPEVITPEPAAEASPEKKKGWLSRLRDGLSKSSGKLGEGVAAIFTKKKLDAQTLDELTDLLITADLGVPAATRITQALAKDRFDKDITDEEVRAALAEEVAATLRPLEQPFVVEATRKPHIVLMVGVNGAGKTTTIGKLAKKYADQGLKVMLAAGDTFRAAAIEQLQVWGERAGAPVIARAVGADAAGLAFDAVKEAQAAGADLLMIDTAGRLQNRKELMDELAKIVRVVKKLDETAPHDVILTLDATVGQNAISQAQVFTEIAGVTGLVMTKLDGTARGGVLVALADKFHLPIHFIGVGEGVEDLQDFNATAFAAALAGLEVAEA